MILVSVLMPLVLRQVLLDSQVIHTIDAMKHDEETHYIDERDLSTVKIKLKEPKMVGICISVRSPELTSPSAVL